MAVRDLDRRKPEVAFFYVPGSGVPEVHVCVCVSVCLCVCLSAGLCV